MRTLKLFISLVAIAAFMNFGYNKVYGQNGTELINMLKEKTSSQEKKDALSKLNQFCIDEKINSSLAKEYSCLIYFAKNNVKAVEYAAELTTKSLRNSEVFLCIAKTAANADSETSFYKDLLELTSLKLNETEKMINNAIKESTTQLNKETETKIKKEIIEIKSKTGSESTTGTL